MLTMYGLPGAWGLPSASPFVSKLETWLRMAGIAYERVLDPMKQGPKKKFPWVKLEDGTALCDSSDIIRELTRRFDVKLDEGLPPAQLGLATLLQRTCEEHLYFAVVYMRWQDPAGWEDARSRFFKGMPPVVAQIAPGIVRSGVKKSLHGQGMGRHTRDEVMDRAIEDVDALAAVLGDQPWFLGDQPRSIDATTWAFLQGASRGPLGRIAEAVTGHENLRAYIERGEARWWSQDD
jgi:glutathione S-transferase